MKRTYLAAYEHLLLLVLESIFTNLITLSDKMVFFYLMDFASFSSAQLSNREIPPLECRHCGCVVKEKNEFYN